MKHGIMETSIRKELKSPETGFLICQKIELIARKILCFGKFYKVIKYQLTQVYLISTGSQGGKD